ncbi:hypothetical protein [Antarcticirhabdus aurantiaca]|uniref:Uncharacterized protein n=1 Tax=Antarcticirhabdus aurantiaca TaxID=2606717 RepID=A0ACD4NWU3_9HYPH|nr:hypothetical protein [Antarcticirhabdus aurantiaca]WAJ31164.1 hypothetical protein OXU80_13575 [Jeongeuplla avenae]
MKLQRESDRVEEDVPPDIFQGGFSRPAVDHREAAHYRVVDFGTGRQQGSTFVVKVNVADVRQALHLMRRHGNLEARRMLADLELGTQVRELVEKERQNSAS